MIANDLLISLSPLFFLPVSQLARSILATWEWQFSLTLYWAEWLVCGLMKFIIAHLARAVSTSPDHILGLQPES